MSDVNAPAIQAVAYCHLGSGRAARPESDTAFGDALRNGLLAHDPIWRATERGIGALVAAGLVAGEPAPEFVRLHILWAQHGDEDPSRHWPQFVAAFSDGIVDAWREHYEAERARAEADYRDMLDEHYSSIDRFFVTVIETPRPAFPEDPMTERSQ